MVTGRRQFLQAAGTASLCLVDPQALRGLAAFGAEAPEKIRFGPDLEPVVQLMEETRREDGVRVFVDELRHGLPYRKFLAASLFAGIRRARSNHEVYKIHAMHQMSMDVLAEERLLPLFWGLNVFKQRQEDFSWDSMSKWSGPLPLAERAAGQFQEAIQNADRDQAESAIIAMARGQGTRPTMEQLWQHGSRNGGAGGHMAICLANCFRALEIVGWEEAEPALRFVVQDWFAADYVKPDRYHQLNQARVDEHLAQLPPDWAGQHTDRAATIEMLAQIREGVGERSSALAIEQLRRSVGAQSIWDAAHLATAELLIRHKDGWGLASRPLHSNTSTNAMHYAFRTASVPATRLLILLQAVAWATDKTCGDLAGGGLRDLSITDLPAITLPASSEDAITEIFAQLPARHYRWDKKEGAVLTYGARADADEACRKVFVLARERPEAIPRFVQTARSWLCRKASNDSHEYKFLAAILEDVGWVSPEWRPHLLAAAVHYFHGDQSPDNPVITQVRETLRSIS
jgi:hypothetical protein